MVPESQDERKETEQRPSAVFHWKSLILRAPGSVPYPEPHSPTLLPTSLPTAGPVSLGFMPPLLVELHQSFPRSTRDQTATTASCGRGRGLGRADPNKGKMVNENVPLQFYRQCAVLTPPPLQVLVGPRWALQGVRPRG